MAKRKLYRSKLFTLGLTALICTTPMETMALSSKTLLAEAKTIESANEAENFQIPELLITEILPDSKNVNGADAYEFIEVYNNSTIDVNLKDYKIYYNYPDKGDESDVMWVDINEDINVKSGEAIVFWIKNGSNDTLTASDFNDHFKVQLQMDVNLFEVYSAGMANSGARALRLTTSIKEQVDFVAYNMNGVKDTSADKSIKYLYDENINESVIKTNKGTPDPGTVKDEDKPKQAISTIPQNEPTVVDMTEETFITEEEVVFKVNAKSDETNIKTVKLSYRNNKMSDYETYNLLKEEGDVFSKIISKYDLIGKAYFDYYFEVSDGFTTVKTPIKRITNTEVDTSAIRFNINENTYLSGIDNLITTGDKLFIDGEDKTSETVESIENNAKIVFDIKDTDTFFKNAVAIGDTVLGIFNEGTYDNWDTVAYDVDPVYFIKGEKIQIDIHAGNKANALEHNWENNDDFVVKNIRLILPDGSILRPEGFENPEEVIKMGDSAGKIEILEAIFTPSDESFNALRYEIDTTKLSDGEHTFSGSLTASNESEDIKFIVDNTAPEIITNIKDDEIYKGTNEIIVDAKDALSGVKEVSVKLDNKKIELPYTFRSLELSPGEHTLTIYTVDNCNNEHIKEIKFIIPEENAKLGLEITPGPGAILTSDPTFKIEATDSTNDIMTVSFKKGERYVLGDYNISKTEGVSQSAGTNGQDFTADSSNGFPYEEFDIELSEEVNENASIQVDWTGTSNNLKIKMYAYNYTTGSFDLVEATMEQNGEEIKLTGLVSLKDHLKDSKVKIMVQNGEGYTPTQYEAGTPATPSENPNITTSNENDLDRNSYDFTFAIESDTQYYNEDTSDNTNIVGKYEHQLNIHDWLLANRSRMNIQYLFHDGDIVDDVDMISQWENADAAYKKLDEAGLPYGVLAGNHDVGHLTGDYTNYGTYFGEDRFINNPWYGESYKNNRAHYDLISVDGIDFIMMYVGWGIGDEEIEWMNNILKKYPERKAILNFHEYLLASGGLGEEPQRVLNEVVSTNSNVCMVLSGHYHNAQTVVNEFDDDGDGVNDRKVYQMLFDYQGLPEGGMGYLRLMHFDLTGEKVVFKTYSPSLDDYNAKDTVAGGDTILGEEDFEISFADLGIEPKTKTIETTNLDVNVYTDEVIGVVNNVTNDTEISYTLENAVNGVYGWYAEVTDDFGGLSRTNVNYFIVDKDIVKPVITLPENNIIPLGAEFNPKDGVSAKDDIDGDLTSKIVVSGSVDTSKEGEYKITYTVSDSSGNTETVSRVITVENFENSNEENNDEVEDNNNTNIDSENNNSEDYVTEDTIENEDKNTLPQTGADVSTLQVSIFAMLSIAIGTLLNKRKRK
ncbi:immunoglobulin-like domain-containing protein [uncultured Clostridium sp.]|uniref:immunoglobulin-like domain-containing protein n=1 Tax=uncultured Clostridium sp. TaxID=59620 RepID=UPI00258A61C6|nr:immunoglobulin-like domain-containing protein [uncultured Clostridium sp.]